MEATAVKPRYWGTSEANRRRVWSADTLRKLSLRMTGNTFGKGMKKPGVSKALKGRVVPWSEERKNKHSLALKGVPRSLEVREKISKGVFKRVVEGRHHNYKGGITPENRAARRSLDYRIWREAVFKRDNFTCQECGVRGGSLHSHHIKPFAYFPELRFAIDNGLTICVSCHEKTENYKKKLKQYE